VADGRRNPTPDESKGITRMSGFSLHSEPDLPETNEWATSHERKTAGSRHGAQVKTKLSYKKVTRNC
jgi:hypothetical protein